MVDIKTLNVGDVVKIVDKWNRFSGESEFGEMDHWLGKNMTVKGFSDSGKAKMVEDAREHGGIGWFWNEHCIDSVVSRAISFEPEPLDDEQVLSLFMK